jgi:hypothetical protein
MANGQGPSDEAPPEPTRAPEDETFVQLTALIERDLYQEYLAGLDELPVLRDAVQLPPPPPPDFRQGERPDLRKARRDDAHAARERRRVECEHAYLEYSTTAADASRPAKRPQRRSAHAARPPKPKAAKAPKRVNKAAKRRSRPTR